MGLSLAAAPSGDVVSLSEAKAALRVDTTDEDPLIIRLVAAATTRLDGADGLLGRALLTQQWALTLDGFTGLGDGRIILPLPPAQSVDSIVYVDAAGADQTMASGDYQVVTSAEPGYVVPAYGTSWPSARCQPDAVTVTFTTGYGAQAADVPDTIRQAILLMVGTWFEHREAVVIGQTPAVVPMSADALLAPHRIIAF